MTTAPRPAITVVVNGVVGEVGEGSTVADLVRARVGSPKGVAVAVNAEVVPRSAWAVTELAAGDRVELLTAAQGG